MDTDRALPLFLHADIIETGIFIDLFQDQRNLVFEVLLV
jgi:hypothetical protein